MTTATKMPKMTILRNDPVREAFSGRSTGNNGTGYYDTKGHALRAYNEALGEYGYHLDNADNAAWSSDEGRHEVDVYDMYGYLVGRAILYYYRMPSGRYEFVGYLV